MRAGLIDNKGDDQVTELGRAVLQHLTQET
jgi:hypothetical protein